ncbi:SCO3374 family protein [Streptomyces fructofermentans]|uniref:Proline-rich protein n=1 Tax=Streptomyces fructofermentans TaxID=152141 RepID=A0A918NEH0_9ACTN|nr:SCO3374 family protein [Streptomyces fructofermentans]GGX64535.1 hypothetical protein GCM10010515_35190 [Streptomyces fructofermentans]
MVPTVPFPRRPSGADDPSDTIRRWYENELDWPTVPGPPVELPTGRRFDVLDVPAEAGYAAMRHLGPASPVSMWGGRMRLFVAAGSADELPGLLDWLEWGGIPLDLGAIGAGGRVVAPLPPGLARARGRRTREGAERAEGAEGAEGTGNATSAEGTAHGIKDRGDRGGTGGTDPSDREGRGPCREDRGAGRDGAGAPLIRRAYGPQGAAVWLRPPVPGREVEPSLPTLSALGGGGGGAPDLVRLVDTMAAECHRIRLRRSCAQPLAFS